MGCAHAVHIDAGCIGKEFEMDFSEQLRLMNQANREFWAKQSPLLPRRMADEGLRQIILSRLQDEQIRLPTALQKSLDALGDEAEKYKSIVGKQRARNAGSQKKTDKLQEIIMAIVRKSPNITTRELHDKLLSQTSPGAEIEAIEDGQILFQGRRGRRPVLSNAPVSGLKDRLSRAKKILRSR